MISISLWRSDSLFVFRSWFLFSQKSVSLTIDLQSLWVNSVSFSPLSEISNGWWLLLLLDEYRILKPPWAFSFSNALPIIPFRYIRLLLIMNENFQRRPQNFMFGNDDASTTLLLDIDVKDAVSSLLMIMSFCRDQFRLLMIMSFCCDQYLCWNQFSIDMSYHLRICAEETINADNWWCLFFTANYSSLWEFFAGIIISELHSCGKCLDWIQSMWQQPWERRQWIFQDEFRESLPKSSNILITKSKQVSDSSPTTSNLIYLIKVMPSAFWSFSSKLIANQKYVKEGLNRLHLLLVSLPNGSRVTSTLSSKLYQFPVFAYNGRFVMFLYLVNTF